MAIEPSFQKGIPIEILVKVKPEPYQRQDLRIYENKISLLDPYDRAVDEFITNGAILDGVDVIRNNFDPIFRKYLNAITQGINLTIFTFGAKSTGKSFCLEGNANESGFYSLLLENLFLILDNKREAIIEEIQALNIPEVESTSFTYQIRFKYVEIKDENLIDLLQKYNYYKQPTQLIYTESEGYSVSGAAWVNISNSMAFPDLFSDAVKFRSNYEYNKVNKSSTMLTFEVTQILENRATRDVKHIVSRINIFDLASADILAEHFRNLANSIEYKSMYAFQNMVGELAKSHNLSLPTIYENSILTKLMKEYIGGNGLTIGIFSMQNNNYPISSIAFKFMKLCSHIQNYPVVNDSNSSGLFKKFRIDINYYSRYKENTRPHLHDIKPPIVPLGKMETQGMSVNNPYLNTSTNQPNQLDNQSLEEFKKKNMTLEKENLRLINELAQSEEEKKRLIQSLALSKNKVDTFKDYINPLNAINPLNPMEHYDLNVVDKLKHLDDDVDEVNEIMNTVNQLHDKLKSLQDERRQMEEEISALKTNNQTLVQELDKITINANSYRTNADNELYSMKELLNSTKNEVDYMRNEAEKYRKIQSDLMLEIDEREVQFKKQLEDKEREIEMKMLDLSQNEKRRLESELREVTRKLENYAGENADYNKIVDELKKENSKLNLQISEMRSTMREILAKNISDKNIINDPNKSQNNISGASSLPSFNPNSKSKLIKSYTDRENELMELVSVEKAKSENLKEKLKRMRVYGRKVRNLALDYFPVNEELPELLTKDLELFVEEAENESVIQFLEYEIRTLRERNKKLEFEIVRVKEEFNSKGGPQGEARKISNNITQRVNVSNLNGNSSIIGMPDNFSNNNMISGVNLQSVNEIDVQKRLLEEINRLKNSRPFSTSKEIEKLKNEREALIVENKKLKIMVS
jgi:hypothetical protein